MLAGQGIKPPPPFAKGADRLHCTPETAQSPSAGSGVEAGRMDDRPKEFGAETRHLPAQDFQEHLKTLDREGLLTRIDRAIDKDSELHPLVRWQFLGGIPEDKRRAFLFTNVVDAKGR